LSKAKATGQASNPDKHRHFAKMKGGFRATIHSSLDRHIDGHVNLHPHGAEGGMRCVTLMAHDPAKVGFDDGTPVVSLISSGRSGASAETQSLPEEPRKCPLTNTSDLHASTADTSIIEPCRPWLSWVGKGSSVFSERESLLKCTERFGANLVAATRIIYLD